MTVKIGLALGSGASRGWAHIGVIRALQKYDIHPDVVCGCSVGAIVGAAYAASRLDDLESWATSLTKMEMAKYAGLNFRAGWINKQRLQEGFNQFICEKGATFDQLDKPFGCVATDLHTGREIWFTQGDLQTGMWASMSLPGLFPPVLHEDKWLVDGGLVNPVPVSMCRSLGADVVIAVDLNGDIVGKHRRPEPGIPKTSPLPPKPEPEPSAVKKEQPLLDNLRNTVMDYSSSLFAISTAPPEPVAPGFFDTIAGAVNIMQDRITRSRMAGDPPEILLSPRLSDIGILEFYRAEEAIQVGYDVTLQQLEGIRRMVGAF